MRALWGIGGVSALALGTLGLVLPLVPTVPFILLAAYCFARSSDRLHDWLLEHDVFGPVIHNWRETGSISLRVKRLATVSIAVVFVISLAMGLRPVLLVLQAVILGAVLTFIWTRPAD